MAVGRGCGAFILWEEWAKSFSESLFGFEVLDIGIDHIKEDAFGFVVHILDVL